MDFPPPATASSRRPDAAHPDRRGFTLIELLVVIGIVAILSALLTPAVQGLMGTNGRRGGLNTVTAVLDQARLAAIENGTTVYVGFPTNAQNKTNGFSHLIVFRDPRPDEGSANPVTLTRWQKLPSGVYFEAGSGLAAAVTTRDLPSRALPPLGGSENLRRIPSLAFNRFGQLQGASGQISLLLGEKLDPTRSGEWRGSSSNYFELRIQPLTGRVVVDDASMSDR